MRVLRVDDRWRGAHGIGRFATETLSRIDVEWAPLGGGASPTSARDIVNIRRAALSPVETVFTPGFNAGLTRARQVLTIHDLIHLSIPSGKQWMMKLYYNLVVKPAVIRAKIVMTVSAVSALEISRWLNAPTVEIIVVGCGRSKEFVPLGPREAFVRPTFLYVGNLKAHKNVEVLFAALADRRDYDLIVVTSDVDQGRERAQAAGVASQVSFRSGIPDEELAVLYRGAAGVLQPSLLEGFGLPVLEAMSCGVRVASWLGCGSVEEIKSGSGVSIESADSATQWAEGMDELIAQSQSGPLQMSEDWEALYDWDTVGSKINAVLNSL